MMTGWLSSKIYSPKGPSMKTLRLKNFQIYGIVSRYITNGTLEIINSSYFLFFQLASVHCSINTSGQTCFMGLFIKEVNIIWPCLT